MHAICNIYRIQESSKQTLPKVEVAKEENPKPSKQHLQNERDHIAFGAWSLLTHDIEAGEGLHGVNVDHDKRVLLHRTVRDGFAAGVSLFTRSNFVSINSLKRDKRKTEMSSSRPRIRSFSKQQSTDSRDRVVRRRSDHSSCSEGSRRSLS